MGEGGSKFRLNSLVFRSILAASSLGAQPYFPHVSTAHCFQFPLIAGLRPEQRHLLTNGRTTGRICGAALCRVRPKHDR